MLYLCRKESSVPATPADPLVAALVRGDQSAFADIFRKHNGAMNLVAQGICGSRAMAEEVAQETWLAILRTIGGFEGRSSLTAWIFAILVNKARTRAQVEGRSVSFDGEEDNTLADAFDGRGHWKNMPELWDEITPERILQGNTALEVGTAAIDTLPPAQRSVLILRSQQGLDAVEICAVLQISEGNCGCFCTAPDLPCGRRWRRLCLDADCRRPGLSTTTNG